MLPVATLGADGEQALLDDVLAAVAHELAEAGDAGDAAAAQRALEDDRGVVLPRGRRLELPPARDAGPLAEQIDVAGVVHLIDEVRAAGAAADLAEHDLAVGLLEPLHVREAAAHAEGAQHLLTEGDAVGDGGLREVAHGDDDRADPLVGARDERLGQVLRDVHERGHAVDAHSVEGELVALDELLEADLGHVLGERQHLGEIGGAVDLVGVGAAGAGDGLQHQRVAELLGDGVGLGGGADPGRARHPQAGGGDALLHELLVAEPEDGVVAHAGQPEPLAQARGGQHQHLPVGEHAVDAAAADPGVDPLAQIVLVEEPRHLQVVGEVGLERRGQRRQRRVADAVHAGADLGQATRVLLHLGRVAGGEKDDFHAAQPR